MQRHFFILFATLSLCATGCELFVPVECVGYSCEPRPEDASLPEEDAGSTGSDDRGVDASTTDTGAGEPDASQPPPALYRFAECEVAELPEGWSFREIGSSGESAAGFHDDVFCVHSSGRGIDENQEGFAFASMAMTGDVSLTTRVAEFNGDHPFSSAGLMIRERTDSGARNVAIARTESEGTRVSVRDDRDAIDTRSSSPQTFGWLRITREGDTITAFASDDGDEWFELRKVRLADLEDTLDVGLVAASKDIDRNAYALFEDVALEDVAPPPPVDCVEPTGTRYDSWTELIEDIGPGETGVLRAGRSTPTRGLGLKRQGYTVALECGAVHVLDASRMPPSTRAALSLEGGGWKLDGSNGRLVIENSPGRGLDVSNSSGFYVGGLTTRSNGASGVIVREGATGGVLENIASYANYGPQTDPARGSEGFGIRISGASTSPRSTWPNGNTLRNCLSHHNSNDGLLTVYSDSTEIENCASWSNGFAVDGVTPQGQDGAGLRMSFSQSAVYDGIPGSPGAPNSLSVSAFAAWSNADMGVLIGSGSGHSVEGLVAFDNGRSTGHADVGYWEVENASMSDSVVETLNPNSSVSYSDTEERAREDFGADTTLDATYSPDSPATFLRELAPWFEDVWLTNTRYD